jgi:hypothetical protein
LTPDGANAHNTVAAFSRDANVASLKAERSSKI